MHKFLIIVIIATACYLVSYVLTARYRAIRARVRELGLFGGVVKLILWEPTEGIVLLKNKKLSEVIETGEGGTKFIFPVLGDEVRARFPLTLRMVMWEDENILTRESIQVHMKVAAWWKATALRKFVFTIDTGIHVENTHRDVGLLEAAEQWLKTMTESTLRTLVSHSSIALLVSSRATNYLNIAGPGQTSEGERPIETTSAIAAALQDDLNSKVVEYGIAIQRIEIQELSFSREIQAAIDRVWKASLLPAQTEQEARARVIALEAEAKVLGTDAVAMAEILRNFQGGTFFGMPAALDAMLSKVTSRAPAQRQLSGGDAATPNVLPGKNT